MFFHISVLIIPVDLHIFQRGRAQPPTSSICDDPPMIHRDDPPRWEAHDAPEELFDTAGRSQRSGDPDFHLPSEKMVG